MMDKNELKNEGILQRIDSPKDIKGLNEKQLEMLAQEIREVLVDTVSKNGGHLASNLGVVELTIALHKVFDSPRDQIVFDVGHQTYTHKLLTGRYKAFNTLRTQGGLSGFSRPTESEHDVFFSGHSSTAVSAALGLAAANDIDGKKNHVIAVVGDGALTGGLVYEGLNNAGRTRRKLIVILNDNEMSISQNVGSIARYLAVTRAKPEYMKTKARIETVLKKIPLVGNYLAKLLYNLKYAAKSILYSNNTIFEELGIRYMGPIDGHNFEHLCDALTTAKMLDIPVLLHINTIKGKGYDFAERSPTQFHGISKFDINTGEPLICGTNFSNQFGNFLVSLAEKDNSICAVTAAMSVGTGLEKFSKVFPQRFFDVGIAEEHAVTFSSGLAKNGKIPVFAVYSTFLQRSYDQLIHDASLQCQKIVLAIDRSGFVGEDGETHQGIFDVAFLNSIPNTTVYSPSTYAELKNYLAYAIYKDSNVVAVRYPRGEEADLPQDFISSYGFFDVYGDSNAKITLVTYGRIFVNACQAKKMLNDKGISIKIVKLNRIIPLDDQIFERVKDSNKIFFFEEGIRSAGVGEKFALMLLENEYKGKYNLTAINDCFVEQGSVESLLTKYHLDAQGMFKIVSEG